MSDDSPRYYCPECGAELQLKRRSKVTRVIDAISGLTLIAWLIAALLIIIFRW